MKAACMLFGVAAGLILTGGTVGARITPEADHTVWVTIDSSPVGADVYSVPQDAAKPVRIGSTPCRVPVDLNWATKWFVKRWELISVRSPASICRADLRSDGAIDILLKVRLSKPGYVEQELDVLAFTLNHPGKNWDGKFLWPREARIHADMRPAGAAWAHLDAADEGGLRKVWVARSDASGETGSVVIRANVDGAEVWVDGRRAASVPVEVVLQEGEHTLEVRKFGFTSARRSITVATDERLIFEAILEREQREH